MKLVLCEYRRYYLSNYDEFQLFPIRFLIRWKILNDKNQCNWLEIQKWKCYRHMEFASYLINSLIKSLVYSFMQWLITAIIHQAGIDTLGKKPSGRSSEQSRQSISRRYKNIRCRTVFKALASIYVSSMCQNLSVKMKKT